MAWPWLRKLLCHSFFWAKPMLWHLTRCCTCLFTKPPLHIRPTRFDTLCITCSQAQARIVASMVIRLYVGTQSPPSWDFKAFLNLISIRAINFLFLLRLSALCFSISAWSDTWHLFRLQKRLAISYKLSRSVLHECDLIKRRYDFNFILAYHLQDIYSIPMHILIHPKFKYIKDKPKKLHFFLKSS